MHTDRQTDRPMTLTRIAVGMELVKNQVTKGAAMTVVPIIGMEQRVNLNAVFQLTPEFVFPSGYPGQLVGSSPHSSSDCLLLWALALPSGLPLTIISGNRSFCVCERGQMETRWIWGGLKEPRRLTAFFRFLLLCS